MPWLHYAFFGLMLVMGGAAFALYLRAWQPRAWIWLLVALVGGVGLYGVYTDRADGAWRSASMSAVFFLIALDHFFQFVQSRRAGAPQKTQALLALGWTLLATGSAL